jgi:hypothetical protein
MIGGDNGLQRLGARNYDTIACMIFCWAQSMPTMGHRIMSVKATYNIHVWRPIYGLKQQHAINDWKTRPITTTIHGKYKLRNTPKLLPAIYVGNHVFFCIWLFDLMHICNKTGRRINYFLASGYHWYWTGSPASVRTLSTFRVDLTCLVLYVSWKVRWYRHVNIHAPLDLIMLVWLAAPCTTWLYINNDIVLNAPVTSMIEWIRSFHGARGDTMICIEETITTVRLIEK